jgi:hypothetical protein
MTVGELRRRITQQEFCEWIAYEQFTVVEGERLREEKKQLPEW